MKECIFCQFVIKKRTKHADGLPFRVLHKTKDTLSFLSNVFILGEDGHILVIPKKHYSDLEKIPENTRNQIINHITLLTKVLRNTHQGCNILLNDGKAAGQTIDHSHFHLIPRNEKDKIKIEVYKRKKISSKKFLELNDMIKNQIKNLEV